MRYHTEGISPVPAGTDIIVKNLFCLVDKRGFLHGGEGGIRTLELLLTVTRFPIVRARPATRLLRAGCVPFKALDHYNEFVLCCQDTNGEFFKILFCDDNCSLALDKKLQEC